jgi:hypothetical protein
VLPAISHLLAKDIRDAALVLDCCVHRKAEKNKARDEAGNLEGEYGIAAQLRDMFSKVIRDISLVAAVGWQKRFLDLAALGDVCARPELSDTA